jgi:hypothetical protein
MDGLPAFVARPRVGTSTLKRLAWALVASAILAWVAAHSAPGRAEVVVHVSEANVEVSLGGRTFRIEERRFDPIVCELPAGCHVLVMTRHGRILYQEFFDVRPGQSLVLTAWNPER